MNNSTKFDKLDEMEQFFKKHKVAQLAQFE